MCIPWAQISVLELGTCETVSCTYLIITLAKFFSVDQCRYHQLSFEIASMLSLTVKELYEWSFQCSNWGVFDLRRLHINFQMTENLDQAAYMSEHILPFLAQAPPNSSHSSLAASRATIQSDPFPSLNPMRHLSSISLNHESELNSLNEQIRRYFISTF